MDEPKYQTPEFQRMHETIEKNLKHIEDLRKRNLENCADCAKFNSSSCPYFEKKIDNEVLY